MKKTLRTGLIAAVLALAAGCTSGQIIEAASPEATQARQIPKVTPTDGTTGFTINPDNRFVETEADMQAFAERLMIMMTKKVYGLPRTMPKNGSDIRFQTGKNGNYSAVLDKCSNGNAVHASSTDRMLRSTTKRGPALAFDTSFNRTSWYRDCVVDGAQISGSVRETNTGSHAFVVSPVDKGSISAEADWFGITTDVLSSRDNFSANAAFLFDDLSVVTDSNEYLRQNGDMFIAYPRPGATGPWHFRAGSYDVVRADGRHYVSARLINYTAKINTVACTGMFTAKTIMFDGLVFLGSSADEHQRIGSSVTGTLTTKGPDSCKQGLWGQVIAKAASRPFIIEFKGNTVNIAM